MLADTRGAGPLVMVCGLHFLPDLFDNLGLAMLGIPRRYAHFVFGILQSGLTSAIASGIASAPFLDEGQFLSHWLRAWLVAWLLMLPVVVFAAPHIRRVSYALTRED